MNNILNKFGFSFLFLLVFLCSCEKSDSTRGLSTITNYPIITLNGDQWNTVSLGGSFIDQGVVALEGDTEIEVTTTGAVDTNTPGVYTISYTALNKDGYSASEYRYVGVIDPSVVGTDMSGTYKRNAGAQGISEVTKISENFYRASNVGGIAVPDASVAVYFYHYAEGLLGVPYQNTPGNAFECMDATVELGVNYKWVVLNSGYGTALRTFVKL